MTIVQTASVLHFFIQEISLFVALMIAGLGLDDFICDISYLAHRICRKSKKGGTTMTWRDSPHACAPTAIFIPTWQEEKVIGPMLRHLTRTMDHPNYIILVGVYPNDPATAAAIAAIKDPRIHMVRVPHDGPTTKADCLNAIWRALAAIEMRWGHTARMIVLHDAEDAPHPQELRLLNHWMQWLDLAQLPVIPFPNRRSRWVAGHYLDEFAEAHFKELRFRQIMGAGVPSAGVACAIRRDALAHIARMNGGALFDGVCLTEDYELGLRLHAQGRRTGIISVRDAQGTPIAVRAPFPATLRAAIRQKTRWQLGIVFQSWGRLGWFGAAANRWFLARDRKAIFTAFVNLALLTMILLLAAATALHQAQTMPGTSPWTALENAPIPLLLQMNGALLFWRVCMRAAYVGHLHGLGEALCAIPRMLVSSLINFIASFQALSQYIGALATRKPLPWDKTHHDHFQTTA